MQTSSLTGYWIRFGKRLWEDASRWIRDNILWNLAFITLSFIVGYALFHTPVNWQGFWVALLVCGIGAVGCFMVHCALTPWRLDVDRQKEIDACVGVQSPPATAGDSQIQFRSKLEVVSKCLDRGNDLFKNAPDGYWERDACEQWNNEVEFWIAETQSTLTHSVGKAAATRFVTDHDIRDRSYPGIPSVCERHMWLLNLRVNNLTAIAEQGAVFFV